MSARLAATVGNGRFLARVGADGSLLGLSGPQLSQQLLEKPIQAVLAPRGGRRRRLGGRAWTHRLEFVRGTNVLRVISIHSDGTEVERRLAAIGDALCTAYRSTGEEDLSWERELPDFLPAAALNSAQGWPVEFDPPPLGGATRAIVIARIPDLEDRSAASALYSRSVLVIAQHHDRTGAFAAGPQDDVLIAHALDVCGERGAARAFFEWALSAGRDDSSLAWVLERHLRWSRSQTLQERLTTSSVERVPPDAPSSGAGAALWRAWQHALAGRRGRALAAYSTALRRRPPLDLFLAGGGIDLRAHALFLLTTHALVPATQGGEDFFFEHEADVQDARKSRALFGGAFHAGMPEPGEPPRLEVEVNTELDVAGVTLELAGGSTEALSNKGSGVWALPPPTTPPGDVTRYRLRIRLREQELAPIWASDSDPRPGGQEFSYEASPPPPPDWLRDALCYQIMVDRFARPGTSLPPPGKPTSLYGGTLDGIREHLDHIAGLGCNVLWLSPVHLSPSHHGYDHEDFLMVEPRYGGEAALKGLVESAHARGMRVLLDFVPNHTGRGHHLFREAIEHDGDAADYYRFWQWPHYYRSFFDNISLPELDTGSRRVQEHLVRVAQHWLTEYGVDGLRCDHVAGVDPAFWVELRRGVRAVKPDALVLGEATGSLHWLARYAGRLDAIFDFEFAHVVREALARGRMGPIAFARWLDEHDRAFPGLALATLIDNHDMNRFLWMARGRADRLKLAATLLMTLPGMPVIYYGTEVGLTQRVDGLVENAEARLPMLWGDDQDRDLLAHFQRLGRQRRNSLALRRGQRRTVLADAAVLAYERSSGAESVLVALNFSERPQRRELPALTGPIELGPLGSTIIYPP